MQEAAESKRKEPRQRGQVIPRGDKTFLIRIPLPSAKGSKRRYHNKTLHNTTEAKAWKYADKVLDQIADGTFFEPVTVGERVAPPASAPNRA